MNKIEILSRALESLEFVVADIAYLVEKKELAGSYYVEAVLLRNKLHKMVTSDES